MLNRLRHHRLLWVLVLTVLSFKLVAGTVCLNDTSVSRHAASVATSATTQSMAAVNPSFDDNGNACLLGETGSCHCACAETLPVPVALSLHVAPVESRFVFHAPASEFSPAWADPLLRPPIA
jgi:hypothetical protein